MRVLLAALLALPLALSVSAAPVPKAKKTTEQKLLGKWRMVKSDGTDSDKVKTYEFYVIFKEEGEFELRYEYTNGPAPRSYTGTFKVLDGDKIDYSVKIGNQ